VLESGKANKADIKEIKKPLRKHLQGLIRARDWIESELNFNILNFRTRLLFANMANR
jgi:hypothetical protein